MPETAEPVPADPATALTVMICRAQTLAEGADLAAILDEEQAAEQLRALAKRTLVDAGAAAAAALGQG